MVRDGRRGLDRAASLNSGGKRETKPCAWTIYRTAVKSKIDAIRREPVHLGDAIADDDAMRSRRRVLKMTAGRPWGRPATRHYHDSEL